MRATPAASGWTAAIWVAEPSRSATLEQSLSCLFWTVERSRHPTSVSRARQTTVASLLLPTVPPYVGPPVCGRTYRLRAAAGRDGMRSLRLDGVTAGGRGRVGGLPPRRRRCGHATTRALVGRGLLSPALRAGGGLEVDHGGAADAVRKG